MPDLKFPRVVYRGQEARIAQNAEEHAIVMEHGWTNQPTEPDPPVTEDSFTPPPFDAEALLTRIESLEAAFGELAEKVAALAAGKKGKG